MIKVPVAETQLLIALRFELQNLRSMVEFEYDIVNFIYLWDYVEGCNTYEDGQKGV